MNRLRILLSNPHTTGAGVLYIIATGLEELGPIWCPHRATEFQATAKWMKGVAVVWGLSMAGDAKPIATQPTQKEP